MPAPYVDFRAIRKKAKKGLEKGMLGAVYRAYTKWNQRAYRYILSSAPISKTPSQRWPAGFVKSHIKLVTKKRPPYRYQEVDVPGKYSRGSRAWRAWIVIRALHEGWTTLPFERKPTRKKALGLPVIPGARVPRPGQSKIAVKKVVQKKQITLNPWIKRTFEAMEWEFPEELKKAIAEIKKEKEKVV